MTPGRMSIIVNSPLFKQYMLKMSEERDKGVYDITKQLQEVSPSALENIERTMYTAKSETLRFNAAKDLLDRAGYGALSKNVMTISGQVNVETHNMTSEEIKTMLLNRMEKIQTEVKDEKELQEKAETLEVEYDVVEDEERSLDEHKEELTRIFSND
jgi:hypothetical protein